MKRYLSLLLTLALLLALAGCRPFQSLYQNPLPDTEVPTTEVATTSPETLPDGPVILPTQPDPEKLEQERLDAEQDRYEAEQDRLNTEQDRQEALQQRPSQPVQDDDRPRPTPPEQDAPQDPTEETSVPPTTEPESKPYPDPDGSYTTKDAVALYIHVYGRLPSNYITKGQAKSQYGSTKKIPSYMNIGGDRFYNKEGRLPAGHTYYECDIGTSGGANRGAKRIVFSSDGLIYYTADHYGSFTLLYGEP